jgi:hypothetical protein
VDSQGVLGAHSPAERVIWRSKRPMRTPREQLAQALNVGTGFDTFIPYKACASKACATCGRGGTGRRAALRALWGRPRGSSSLLDRTITNFLGWKLICLFGYPASCDGGRQALLYAGSDSLVDFVLGRTAPTDLSSASFAEVVASEIDAISFVPSEGDFCSATSAIMPSMSRSARSQ